MQPATAPARDLPVYVWCTGQDDNIGDVVLRRRLLDELRPLGRLHVFLGDSASDGFVEALRLGPDDVVVRAASAWTPAVAKAARVGAILCVGKPGELPVDRVRLRRSLRRLLLHWYVVRNKGLVVQLGIGARAQPQRFMPLFRWSFRFHRMVRWRDPQSQAHFRLGAVMPDWGFDDRGALPVDMVHQREFLVLSMRVDRPAPGPAWLEGIRLFCRQSGLTPVVATQVRRDRERNGTLAQALAARHLDWDGQSHADQEQRLRELYARSALVVSDRLHVLIVAMTEGAVPFCVLDRAEEKIGRHFDAIGYRRASVDGSGLPPEGIARHLEAALDRAGEARAAKAAAAAAIAQVGRELRALVASQVPAE